jgi:oligopeptide/dipeptide ABC transporter ATP-binding protein
MTVILQAQDLKKHFAVGGGFLKKSTALKAVDGASLSVNKGETFAIVGESGCGKSTLARLLMRLLVPTAGEVMFDGRAIARLQGADVTALRKDVQFIFQDPFSSLNPRMTVAQLIAEPLEIHRPDLTRADRRKEVGRLLAEVGLRPGHMDRYPHEFSGGQRQRIGIARALASGPRVLIADEPVSALDVSVQAQVVNLLGDLRDQLGLTLIIIAHDLAVIRHMSDRIAVMYLGRVVETGPTDEIFANPRHPYTRALMSAIPAAEYGVRQTRQHLTGETPSPLSPPSGCTFRTRCPHATELCAKSQPMLEPGGQGAEVACHHWRDLADDARMPDGTNSRTAGATARFEMYRAALATSQIP